MLHLFGWLVPVTLVLGVALVSCSAQNAAKPVEFVSREHHVAFTPPAGWEQRRLSDPSSVVGFIDTRSGAAFAPRVQLVSTPTPRFVKNNSLPTNAESERELKAAFRDSPHFRFLGATRFTVGGVEAQAVAYLDRDPATGTLLRTRQVNILRGGRLYLFTLGSEADQFERHRPQFDQVVRSVRWLP